MEKEKDPGAVAMAKRRAESLTPERRKEIAENAVAARWKKAKAAKKAVEKAEREAGKAAAKKNASSAAKRTGKSK